MTQDIYTGHWITAKEAALRAGLQIVEHGWEQHVIIDETAGIVYRYPRHETAAAKLTDEVSVLKAINREKWKIGLPVMLEHNDIYASYRYVPGEVIMHGQSKSLSDEQCNSIGTGLGEFLARLHNLDHNIVSQKKTRQTTSLLEYYTGRIISGTETPFYDPASRRLNELLKITDGSLQVVVHGDLHGPNIVIDPASKKLNGVIDFSEVEIGNPHQEFRKIFMTDTRLLQPACDSYEKNCGQALNTNEIVLWAYVNEWANLCHFAGEPDNATYRRALDHLRLWEQI